jgi:hypothetical protein
MQAGPARSAEHCCLTDDEVIVMAEQAGPFIVPTMQMTREDKGLLQAGKLPELAVWKFRCGVDALEAATGAAAELLQIDEPGVLAPGEQVDFVMRAGRVYRHEVLRHLAMSVRDPPASSHACEDE